MQLSRKEYHLGRQGLPGSQNFSLQEIWVVEKLKLSQQYKYCKYLCLFHSFYSAFQKVQELIKGISSISVSMGNSRGPAIRGKGKILPIYQVCLQLLMAPVLSGKCLQ